MINGQMVRAALRRHGVVLPESMEIETVDIIDDSGPGRLRGFRLWISGVGVGDLKGPSSISSSSLICTLIDPGPNSGVMWQCSGDVSDLLADLRLAGASG